MRQRRRGVERAAVVCFVLAALLGLDGSIGFVQTAAADSGWEAIGPVPRYRHAMAYDGARGVMVMFGGQQMLHQNPQAALLGDTWEFSGQPGSVWTPRSVAGPSPRSGHSMVYDTVRGVTVLFGGVTSVVGATSIYSGETWEYDGTAWTLRPIPGPSPRSEFAFAFDSVRGVAVLHGGYNGERSNETWEYNGEAWTLRATDGPGSRSSHAMAFDSVRNVCVMSGGVAAPGVFPNDTWEYDSASGFWMPQAAAVNSSAILPTMTFDPVRNVVLRWGGDPFYGFHTWNGGGWTQLTVTGRNSVRSRWGHAAAYDSARQVIVMFGGYDDNGSVWNDTWEIASADVVPQAVERNPAPHPGSRHQMYFDSHRRLAIVHHADVMWEWDGAARTWTKRPAPGPGFRSGFSIVYDSQRQVAVLFGGYMVQGGVAQGDTWEWNGRTGLWTLRSTTGPSPRYSHDMAFDAARGVTVLFGGTAGSDETWEWDGIAWTQRQIPGPPPRAGHAMVFDAQRNVVMLHGGTNGTIKYSDTWEFDGTQWTLRSTVGPSPHRTDFAMAYDDVHHQTVMFGGYAPPVPFGYVNELWTWNGAAWTLRQLPNGPEPRDQSAMAFDSGQGNFVIVGGHGWIGPQRDQWLLRVLSICPADLDHSGSVNVDDLLAVIHQWGACPAPPQACLADLSPPSDGDGVVNVGDLLMVVGNWGSCR